MSETPDAADDVMKLLDAGWTVVLFRNDLGSYTACASRGCADDLLDDLPECQVTDDFTPSKALYRLTEKLTTGRIA